MKENKVLNFIGKPRDMDVKFDICLIIPKFA